MQITRPQFGSLQLTAQYFNVDHQKEGFHVSHHFTPDRQGKLFLTVDEHNQEVEHLPPELQREIANYSHPDSSDKGKPAFFHRLYASLEKKFPGFPMTMVWDAFKHRDH